MAHDTVTTIILNGREHPFDVAVNMMDDDIREALAEEIGADCTEQEFLDAYVKAHAVKFGGEEFVLV